ncbi:hypothetical protein [Actinobaculum sp. 313]|nr:hypothetical protein [Actinobaculum sp. 313]
MAKHPAAQEATGGTVAGEHSQGRLMRATLYFIPDSVEGVCA